MKLPHLTLTTKIAILLFIVALSVYVFGACRHNPGYADSDEMITIGYLLGSAHPSGYPLQMWLTKFFTMLPIPGSIAFRANVMNSFFHALTVVLMFLSGTILIRFLWKKERYPEILPVIISLFGSLMLAFSGLFWLYSGVAEVVALNDFLVACTLFSSLQWYKGVREHTDLGKGEYVWFLVTWGLAGLGMTHVHTVILLFPALGIMLALGLFKYKRFKMYGWFRILLPLLIFAFCFIIPNLSLIYLNGRQQNVSWWFDQSVSGWYNHLRRRVYSGYIPEKDIHVSSYIAKLNIGQYLKTFPYYWAFMTEHFSIFGVILGLLGLAWIWLKNREIACIVNAFVLVTGLLFCLYMVVPDKASVSLEYRSLIGITHRQYLIGETMWSIVIILGIWAVIDILLLEVKKLNQKYLPHITAISGCLLVAILFVYNLPMGMQRNNTHAWDYAKTVLEPLPQDAVLMCFADFSCFSLMYAQEVEGIRPDVKLVSKNIYIKGYWLRRHPELKGLEDTDNPYFSADIISWNLFNGRRVFLTDSVGYYVNYIGLEGNPFFIIPNGYTFEVVTKVPQSIPTFSYQLTDKLLSYKRTERDYWFAGQKDYFSNFHTITSLVYSYLNLKEGAMLNLRQALVLTPDYKTAINIYNDLPNYNGNPNYYLGQESSPSAYYLTQAKELIAAKQLDPAFKSLQKATFRDPKNIEARSMLAELLITGRYYREALMEYKNILRFYPQQTEIAQRIEQINTAINQSSGGTSAR